MYKKYLNKLTDEMLINLAQKLGIETKISYDKFYRVGTKIIKNPNSITILSFDHNHSSKDDFWESQIELNDFEILSKNNSKQQVFQNYMRNKFSEEGYEVYRIEYLTTKIKKEVNENSQKIKLLEAKNAKLVKYLNEEIESSKKTVFIQKEILKAKKKIDSLREKQEEYAESV